MDASDSVANRAPIAARRPHLEAGPAGSLLFIGERPLKEAERNLIGDRR